MPRITGHTPSGAVCDEGWLTTRDPVYSGVHDSFLETLARLHRVPVGEASWLQRPAGVGVVAELKWREYANGEPTTRSPTS
jgi:hypothetical protein